MSEQMSFSLQLEQTEGFEFKVKFDWPDVAELLLDEPEPLGKKHGPNAARLIAAAVANCVTIMAMPAVPSAASSLPALNPNQPTHNIPAPTVVNTRLLGFIGCCG